MCRFRRTASWTTGAAGVTIGDHAMIGPLTCIVGVNYSYARLDQAIALQPKTSKGIRIGKGVMDRRGLHDPRRRRRRR